MDLISNDDKRSQKLDELMIAFLNEDDEYTFGIHLHVCHEFLCYQSSCHVMTFEPSSLIEKRNKLNKIKCVYIIHIARCGIMYRLVELWFEE